MMWITWNNYIYNPLGTIIFNREVELSLQQERDLLSMAMVDMVYKLPALDYRESIQLFSWHTFGKYPPNENYMDLTLEVVYHGRGVPLVVKLLGSCLFGKSASERKNALKEIKRISSRNV